jgi:hypothetical protein
VVHDASPALSFCRHVTYGSDSRSTLIAATAAAANGLALYTKNPKDFAPAVGLVKIVAVLPARH